ncbi:hypothetical protein AX16_007962 [Volvariella volvacea WC 439]|nr:hypothetical protein AX16_007962 [Volvariella volvacea WC 439]
MSTQSTSAFLTDSLATFSQAVYKAFAEVEARCKADVARATAEAREAQRARDEALALLHAAQLEAKSYEQELLACRASLKQTEMKVSHQADTITQLKRDAVQWKDQSRNWQDHFLRVEQERCALASKCNELVAQHLHMPGPHNAAPYTPENDYPAPPPTGKRDPPSKNPPAYTPKEIPPSLPAATSKQLSSAKTAREASKTAKVSKVAARPKGRPSLVPSVYIPTPAPAAALRAPPPPPSQPVTQTVIRRVQAVVHVKEEESSDDEYRLQTTPPSEITEEEPPVTKRRKSQVSVRKRSKPSVVEDDSDETEREAPRNNTRDLSDDDEDELMLGVSVPSCLQHSRYPYEFDPPPE